MRVNFGAACIAALLCACCVFTLEDAAFTNEETSVFSVETSLDHRGGFGSTMVSARPRRNRLSPKRSLGEPTGDMSQGDVMRRVKLTIGTIQRAADNAIKQAVQRTNDAIEASEQHLAKARIDQSRKEQEIRKLADMQVRDAKEKKRAALLRTNITIKQGDIDVQNAKEATQRATERARRLNEEAAAMGREEGKYEAVAEALQDYNRQLAEQKLANEKAVKIEEKAGDERVQKRKDASMHAQAELIKTELLHVQEAKRQATKDQQEQEKMKQQIDDSIAAKQKLLGNLATAKLNVSMSESESKESVTKTQKTTSLSLQSVQNNANEQHSKAKTTEAAEKLGRKKLTEKEAKVHVKSMQLTEVQEKAALVQLENSVVSEELELRSAREFEEMQHSYERKRRLGDSVSEQSVKQAAQMRLTQLQKMLAAVQAQEKVHKVPESRTSTSGARCILPFFYNDEKHDDCITDGHVGPMGQGWCPVGTLGIKCFSQAPTDKLDGECAGFPKVDGVPTGKWANCAPPVSQHSFRISEGLHSSGPCGAQGFVRSAVVRSAMDAQRLCSQEADCLAYQYADDTVEDPDKRNRAWLCKADPSKGANEEPGWELGIRSGKWSSASLQAALKDAQERVANQLQVISEEETKHREVVEEQIQKEGRERIEAAQRNLTNQGTVRSANMRISQQLVRMDNSSKELANAVEEAAGSAAAVSEAQNVLDNDMNDARAIISEEVSAGQDREVEQEEALSAAAQSQVEQSQNQVADLEYQATVNNATITQERLSLARTQDALRQEENILKEEEKEELSDSQKLSSMDGVKKAERAYKSQRKQLRIARLAKAQAKQKYDLALQTKLSLAQTVRTAKIQAAELTVAAQYHTSSCLEAEAGAEGCEHVQYLEKQRKGANDEPKREDVMVMALGLRCTVDEFAAYEFEEAFAAQLDLPHADQVHMVLSEPAKANDKFSPIKTRVVMEITEGVGDEPKLSLLTPKAELIPGRVLAGCEVVNSDTELRSREAEPKTVQLMQLEEQGLQHEIELLRRQMNTMTDAEAKTKAQEKIGELTSKQERVMLKVEELQAAVVMQDPFSPEAKATVAVARAEAALVDAKAAEEALDKASTELDSKATDVEHAIVGTKEATDAYFTEKEALELKRKAEREADETARALAITQIQQEYTQTVKIVELLTRESETAQERMERAVDEASSLGRDIIASQEADQARKIQDNVRLSAISAKQFQTGMQEAQCELQNVDLQQESVRVAQLKGELAVFEAHKAATASSARLLKESVEDADRNIGQAFFSSQSRLLSDSALTSQMEPISLLDISPELNSQADTDGANPSTAHALSCFKDPNGADYRGTVNVTESGLLCQKWSTQTPHRHLTVPEEYPDAGLGAHSFCRNPDGKDRPWCITTSKAVRWEFCDVKPCAGVQTVNTSAVECPVAPQWDDLKLQGVPVYIYFKDDNGKYCGLQHPGGHLRSAAFDCSSTTSAAFILAPTGQLQYQDSTGTYSSILSKWGDAPPAAGVAWGPFEPQAKSLDFKNLNGNLTAGDTVQLHPTMCSKATLSSNDKPFVVHKVSSTAYMGEFEAVTGVSAPTQLLITAAPRHQMPTRAPPLDVHIKVSFQPAEEEESSGYLEDSGKLFGVRPSGLKFGWDAACAADVQQRSCGESDVDKTYVTIKNGNKWKLALPNGEYEMNIGLGDCESLIDNKLLVQDEEVQYKQTEEKTKSLHIKVKITNGLLTIAPVKGEVAHISFIDIDSKMSAAADISFGILWSWEFSKGIGNVVRSSVSGESAPLNSGVSWKAQGVTGGYCLSFDGGSQASIPLPRIESPLESFTVALWVQTRLLRQMMLISWASEEIQAKMSLGISVSGKLEYMEHTAVGGLQILLSEQAVADGKWHHVAVVREGMMVRLYVNGELSASQAFQSKPLEGVAQLDAMLGAQPLDGGQLTFEGHMEDIRLYNRHLQGASVLKLYSLGESSLNSEATVPRSTWVEIRELTGMLCLGVTSSSTVDSRKCDGSDDQKWMVERDGRIKSKLMTEMYLTSADDVNGAARVSTHAISGSDAANASAYVWSFAEAGYIRSVSRGSPRCLARSPDAPTLTSQGAQRQLLASNEGYPSIVHKDVVSNKLFNPLGGNIQMEGLATDAELTNKPGMIGATQQSLDMGKASMEVTATTEEAEKLEFLSNSNNATGANSTSHNATDPHSATDSNNQTAENADKAAAEKATADKAAADKAAADKAAADKAAADKAAADKAAADKAAADKAAAEKAAAEKAAAEKAAAEKAAAEKAAAEKALVEKAAMEKSAVEKAVQDKAQEASAEMDTIEQPAQETDAAMPRQEAKAQKNKNQKSKAKAASVVGK
jgi:hypothetical protein